MAKALIQPDEYEDYDEYDDDYEYVEVESGGGYGRGCFAGCGWLTAALGCMVLVPLAVIVFGIYTGVATIGGIFDSIGDFFNSEPRQATVESTRTIITSIEAQAQLVTITANFSRSNVQVSVRDGFQNTCGFSASYSAEGSVQAGIDLSLVTEDDITYNTLNETFTITLPPPQLIGCTAEVRQIDRSFTMCNADWDGARQIGEYTVTTGFRDESLESGILGRAELEAYNVMNELIGNLVDEEIEIEFEPYDPFGADTILPDACQPQPPLGWDYDEGNGSWSN